MGASECSVKKFPPTVIGDSSVLATSCCGNSGRASRSPDESRLPVHPSPGVVASDLPTKVESANPIRTNSAGPVKIHSANLDLPSAWIQELQSTSEGLDDVLVNHIVAFAWPTIEKYAQRILTNLIEPAVQKALGKFGEKFSFEHSKYHLGAKPTIHTIRAALLNHNEPGTDLERKLIRGTGHFDWNEDISVTTSFKFMKWDAQVTVTKVNIRGVIMIECIDMIPESPLFKGVRFGFMSQPDIQLRFHGNVGKVVEQAMQFQALKDKMTEVLTDAVAQEIVSPNFKGFLLHPSGDYFDIVTSKPQGALEIIVVQGDNLLAKDTSFIQRGLYGGRGTSDPYVILRCGGEKFTSKVIDNTLHPKFDFSVRYLIGSTENQHVNIELWDKDTLFDDFLGKADIQVASMIRWEGPQTIQLMDRDGNEGKSGSILVQAVWRPLLTLSASMPEMLEKNHQKEIFVFCGIYSASCVPWLADDAEFWVLASHSHHACQERKSHQEKHFFKSFSVQRPPARLLPQMTKQDVATKQIQKKLALLRRYNVSDDEKAMLLDIDAAALKSMKARHGTAELSAEEFQTLAATRQEEILFNYSFKFMLQGEVEANVSISLMCKYGGRKDEECLGTHEFQVSHLLALPNNRHDAHTVQLTGSDVHMTLCSHLRMLGTE